MAIRRRRKLHAFVASERGAISTQPPAHSRGVDAAVLIVLCSFLRIQKTISQIIHQYSEIPGQARNDKVRWGLGNLLFAVCACYVHDWIPAPSLRANRSNPAIDKIASSLTLLTMTKAVGE